MVRGMRAWMRPGRAIVVVGLSLLALSACKRDKPLLIRKLLVDIDPAAQARMVRDGVRDRAMGIIDGIDELKRVDERDAGVVCRVRVHRASYGAAPPNADHPEVTGQADVVLTVDLNGKLGDERVDYEGRGVARAFGVSNDDIDFDRLLDQALKDAFEEVRVAKRAEGEDESTLIAWLEDPTVGDARKRRALSLLGSRKSARATDAVVAILQSDDRELAQAALMSISAIGDPSAVDAVIAYADGKPAYIRKQAIEAVRAMGTKKGQAWLFTLSTGHPDPEVQHAAGVAFAYLDQLSRQQEDKTP